MIADVPASFKVNIGSILLCVKLPQMRREDGREKRKMNRSEGFGSKIYG